MSENLPDTNVGNIGYIRKQDAIEEIRKAENHAFNSFYKGLVKAHKIVADLSPADVVEVVRCRDCIYQKPDTVYGGNWCWVHREPFMLKTLDGFCSYGERREE